MKRAVAGLLLVGCLCGAESARAELADDVAAIGRAWHVGGSVRVAPARVMQRAERRPVLLSALETSAETADCVSVAIVGAPSATFVARVTGDKASHLSPADSQRPSVAGVVDLEFCGADKALLGSLEVEMRSPRAIVQAIIVRGASRARPVREVLPRRDPAMVAAPESAGPMPASAPLSVRTGAAERRYRRESADDVGRRLVRADDAGSGDFLLALAEGCHRLDLFGAGAAGEAAVPVDVDAEVSFPDTGEVLSSDRSDSADATASFCLGAASAVRVRFAGAAPRSSVLVLHGRWSLPRGLPTYWGAATRAHMAEALRERRVKAPVEAPVYSSIGVAGVTALPVQTEPGACYQVVAAVMDGHASLSLAATAGDRTSENRSPDDGDGAALAFCAGGADHALVEVEAQGPRVVWLLGVWQTGRVTLGEEAR